MRRTLLFLVAMVLMSVLPLHAGLRYEMQPVGFEGGSLPTGWSVDTLWTIEGGSGLQFPDSTAEGVYRAAARCANGTSASVHASLVSPALNLTGANDVQLSYSYATVSRQGYVDTLSVYYRVNATDEWHLLKTCVKRENWTEDIVALPNYMQGSAYQVKFEMANGNGTGVVLDDISIWNAPTCQNLVFQNVEAWLDSLFIGMSASEAVPVFDVVVSESQVNPDTVTNWSNFAFTTFGSTSSEVEIGGLKSLTTYYVYARTNCSDNKSGYTSWVSRSVMTPRLVSVPYVETFNDTTVIPAGWNVGKVGVTVNAPALKTGTSKSALASYSFDSTSCVFFSNSASSATALKLSSDKPQVEYLATPYIRNANLNELEVSFWATGYTTPLPGSACKLVVGAVSDPANFETFDAIETVSIPSQYLFRHFTVSLASYTGKAHYIAFMVQGNESGNFIALDNVEIKKSVVPTLTNLNLVAVEPTKLTLSANMHGADSWNVFVSDEFVASGVPAHAVANPLNNVSAALAEVALPDSLQGKSIVVYAQAVKGGVPGAWCFPLTVRVPAALSLPYLEDFNVTTGGVLLSSLDNVLRSSSSQKGAASLYYPLVDLTNYFPKRSAGTSKEGAGKLELKGIGSYFTLGYVPVLTDKELRFYLRSYSTTSNYAKVEVGVMENPYDVTTFTVLGTFDGGLDKYIRCVLDLDKYTGNGHYVAIRNAEPNDLTSSYGGAYSYIDKITLGDIPTCRDPQNLQLKAGSTKATLTWEKNNMTSWYVALYGDAELDSLVSDTLITADTLVWTGLVPETSYYYTIQTVCGEDTLEVEDSYTFRTALGIPFTQFSESGPTATTTTWPSAWSLYNGTSAVFFGGTATLMSAPSSNTNSWNTAHTYAAAGYGLSYRHARTEIYSTTFNYWMVSPALSLAEMAPGEGVQLTFDMALTAWSSAAAANTGSTDDRVWVVISEDGGKTWNRANATLWSANPADAADYSYYSIPTTGKKYTIDLTKYVGKVIAVAFGVETPESGTDNSVHVGNVAVKSYNPNCQGVLSLSATAAGQDAVTALWTAGGAQDVKLELYNVSGAAPVLVNTAEHVTASPYVFSGLTPNTPYMVTAVQSCNLQGDTLKAYARTECGAYTIENFGTETFSAADALSCWHMGLDTVGTKMSQSTYNSQIPAVKTITGLGKVLALSKTKNTSSYNYGNNYFAIMPKWDVDSINKYQVQFQAAITTTDTVNLHSLAVGVATDPTDVSSFIFVDTVSIHYANDSLLMDMYVISLENYDGDDFGDLGQYVVFMVSADELHSNIIYLDNISLAPISHCKQNNTLACTAVTPNSASFAWTGNASSYEVLLLDSLYANLTNVSAAHIVKDTIVSTTSVLLDGLKSKTLYYAYLRDICAEGDSAIWSNRLALQTAISVPYLETFDEFALGYPTNGWVGYKGASIAGNKVNVSAMTANTTSSYGWYVSSTEAEIGSTMVEKAVRTEIYSTSFNALLTTPSITIPEVEEGLGYRLTFRIARKPYSSTAASINAATEHFFKVLVSTNDTTFEKVASWEVGKGDNDFNEISMRGIAGKVDLTDYAGQNIRIGFMTGTEKSSTPDTYFSIDSVAINTYSTACGGASNLEVTLDSLTAVATWKVTGAPQKSIIQFSTDPTFETLISTDTLTNVFTKTFSSLAFNSTYYTRVKQADCADAAWVVASCTTPLAIPYAEEWESTTLPGDWSRLTGDILSNKATSTTGGWYLTTSAGGGMATAHAYYGAYHYVSTYSGTHTYYKYSLVTPELLMVNAPGNNIKLSFDLALTTSSSNSIAPNAADCVGHTFAVLVSTDGGKTWASDSSMILTGADYAAIPATATSYEFDLTAFAGMKAMVAFYHGVDSTAPAVSSSTTYINLDKIKLQSVNLSCLAPELTLAGAGVDSLVIALDGDADQFEIEYAKNAAFADAQSLIVASDTAVLSDLTHSSDYYVRARSICGSSHSSWSDAVHVRTECVALTTYPWSENFDAITAAANLDLICWDNMPWERGTGVSGSTGLVFKTYTSGKGGNATTLLQLPDQSKGTKTRLYLPTMQTNVGMEYEFHMDMYRTSASSNPTEGIRVFAVCGGTETELGFISRNFSTADATHGIPAETAEGWYTYSFAVPYDGDAFRVMLQGESDYGSSSYMDNLSVVEIDPNCKTPILTLKKITTDSAVIALDTVAKSYMFELSTNEDFSDADTLYVTNDTVAKIAGLTPATRYYIRARLLCEGDNMSPVSEVLAVITDCALATIPFAEGFESMPTGNNASEQPICWWISPANNGSAPYVYVNDNYAKTGTKSLYCYGSSSTNKFVMLPLMDAELKNLRMTFSYRAGSSSTTNTLRVGYLRTVDNMVVTLQTLPLTSTQWQTAMLDYDQIPDSIGNNYRIAFFISGATGVYIDDINVTVRPQDETLNKVVISNLERRSLDVVWAPSGLNTCNEYDVVLSTTALDAAALDTTSFVTVRDTNVYHADGLERNTMYYAYVRTHCAIGEGFGKWYSASGKTKDLVINENPQLGDGTATAYLVYSSYGNTYSQHIYTAEELTAAGLSAGPISSIAFEYGMSSASSLKIQSIYMGHTTKSAYAGATASDFVSGLQLVYGPQELAKQDGWRTYTLTTPFVWDGVSNIVVGVLTNHNGSNTTTSSGWSTNGTTLTASRTAYRYQDSKVIDPDNLGAVSYGSVSSTRPNTKFAHVELKQACPDVEEVLASALTATSAKLTWTAVEADYLGSYEVLVSDTVVTDFSAVTAQYTGIDSLSLSLDNLTPYTCYNVYVRAICDGEGHNDGVGVWKSLQFRTKADCNTLENVAIVATGKNSAKLTWSRSAQVDNYCYVLSGVQLDDDALETAIKTASGLTDTVAEITGLAYDSTYYVYVANECSAGKYSPFEMVSIHTSALCPAPVNFHSNMTAFNAVQLAWNRGAFGEENEWEVGFVGNAASTQVVTDSMVVIIGLSPETQYVAYVKALCSETESSLATTFTFTTSATPQNEVTLGDGTATAYLVYTGFGNTYSQHIYTADELHAAGNSGGTINTISFYYSGSSSSYNKEQSIYIGTTTKDSYAASTADNFEGGLMLVYGPEERQYQSDWVTYELSTPFEWDGTSNIVVGVLTNQPSGTSQTSSSGWSVYGTSTSPAYRTIYRFKDSYQIDPDDLASISGGNYSMTRPNILFGFEAASCQMAAKVAVSDVTTTSAKLSWFPGGSETKWAVSLADHQLSDAELAALTPDTMDHVMSKSYASLTPDWDYYFYIQSLCSATSASNWKVLKFQTTPTCFVPEGLDMDTVTANSITLSWNKLSADYTGSYTLAYGLKDSFDLSKPATFATIPVADTTVVVSGLTPTTLYTFAIRANCGPDDDSRWSATIDVLTDCGVIDQFPYVEGFDNPFLWDKFGTTYDYPLCWTTGGHNNSTSYTPRVASNTSYYVYSATDTASLYFYSYSSYAEDWPSIAVSPEVVGNMDTLMLRFKMRACYQSRSTGKVSSGYYTSYAKSIKVGSMSELNYDAITELATFTLSGNYASGDSLNALNNYGWEEFELPLVGVTDPYICFYSDFASTNYVWIDDIVIEKAPDSVRPTVTTEAVGAHSAVVKWESNAEAWNVLVLQGTDTVQTYSALSEDTLALTGLNAASNYVVKVQGVCDGATSAWGTISFMTGFVVPFVDALSSKPATWSYYSGLASDAFNGIAPATTSSGWTLQTTNQPAGMESGNMKLNIFGTSCMYWMVTPTIDMTDTAEYDHVRLTFDAAWTKYNNTSAPTETSTDDKFMVIVSTDGGATWSQNNAYIWANDGNGNMGMVNDFQATAQTIEIDLTQYVGGTVTLAFYGESTVSGGDNDFHVANVSVAAFNANCLGVTQLAASTVHATSADVVFKYVAGTTDAYVEVATKSDFAPTSVVYSDTLVNDSVFHVTGLKPVTAYYVRAMQLCGNGETSGYSMTSFTTSYGVPFEPKFTSTTVPADWTRSSAKDTVVYALQPGQSLSSTTGGWSLVDADTVINSYHYRGNVYGTAWNYWLFTPTIDLTDNVGDGVMLNVDLGLTPYSSSKVSVRNTGDDDRFLIAISVDGGQTWSRANTIVWDNDSTTPGYSYNEVPEHGTTYSINMTGYTGNLVKIGFYGESTISNADNYFHFGNIKMKVVGSATINDTVCAGYAYYKNGFEIEATDLTVGDNSFDRVIPASDELPNDSIVMLTIHVNEGVEQYIEDTICAGTAYTKYGFDIPSPTSTRYPLFGTAANGCDSVTYLDLTVLPILSSEELVYACPSEPYVYKGKSYYTSTVIYDTLTAETTGCDSLATIVLQFVNDKSEHHEFICSDGEGYSDEIFTEPIKKQGVYTKTVQGSLGCDSTVTLYLMVVDVVTNSAYDTVTVDQLPYEFLGQVIPAGKPAGNYTLPFTSPCGQNTVLTVTVLDSPEGFWNPNYSGRKIRKVVVDNKLFIVVDDRWYDVTGMSVQQQQE